MKADEAGELMDAEKSTDQFKTRTAIMIAVLAMLLAITGLGGQNAAKEATNNNIFASNLYAFYQAKNIRTHEYTAFAALMDSKADGNKRIETPHLRVQYQPTWRWREPAPPPPGRPWNEQ